MGWRLAEEVAWRRPERPGPEWWTLLDIAQDANDDTRRGWPGREYLMNRAKRSSITIDRYVKTLIDAGALVRVRRAAPGRRPVYEIPILVKLSPTCVTEDDARTCVTEDDARTCGRRGQRASQKMTHERASQKMTHLPSSIPSTSNGSVSGGSLEGIQLARASLPAQMSPIEKAAWQAAQTREQRGKQP